VTSIVFRRQVSREAAIRVAGPTPDESVASSGMDRHPPREPTPGLWPNAIALVNVLEAEAEAGVPNQGDGVTGEVAAIGHSSLEGLQSALPCGHTRIR